MPLIRKTRVSGSSIVITIPSQLVEAYNISCGDIIEIIPLRNNEIKIRKAENEEDSYKKAKTHRDKQFAT
jgi:bifunctional DNA-binding transcriptional regulator/antitoxin component of YhaV-PrlF toxin-antitoxin module